MRPTEPSRWRVMLVDDHAMVRQGLRSILETYPDLEVIGEAADGINAVEAAIEQATGCCGHGHQSAGYERY